MYLYDDNFPGHTEKLYLVRFNPVIQDLLASASYDMTVRLWDVANEEQLYQLDGHTDTVCNEVMFI